MLLAFPFLVSSQKSIKRIQLKFNKKQTEKIENPAFDKGKMKEMKKISEPQIAGELELSIANPYDIPLKLATASTNRMGIIEIQPNSVWRGNTIDYWQNVIIRTGEKDLVYTIKAGNCYSLFWSNNEKAWDIKKSKCDTE